MQPTSMIATNASHIVRGDLFNDFRQISPDGAIDFSSYHQLKAQFAESCVSIKYVLNGTESYKINGNRYEVTTGNYLLLNGVEEGSVLIDSPTPVSGICISIPYELVAEVFSGMCFPGMDSSGLDSYLKMSAFSDNMFYAGSTNLGNSLKRLPPAIATRQGFDKTFYYKLAEDLLRDQADIYRYMTAFDSMRMDTRKDLIRRLMKGKEFIDQHYTAKLDVAAIARMANLSEYYFIRLFKKVFKESPYHYLLEKRLKYAAELLDKKDISVVDIAYSAGFSDIYRFSKSFKKCFGLSPTAYRKRAK